jgi:hypothetical protein
VSNTASTAVNQRYQRGKSTAVIKERQTIQRGKSTAVNQRTTDNTMVKFIDLQLLIYLFGIFDLQLLIYLFGIFD